MTEADDLAPGGRSGSRIRMFVAIVAGWLVIVLAWSVATHMVSQTGSGGLPLPWRTQVLSLLLDVLPWMLATPSLLRLGGRYPVSRPHVGCHLLIQLLFALVLIPGLEAAGQALNLVLLDLGVPSPAAFIHAVSINTLYALPTYMAVIGIGHAVAWLQHYRIRERQLARMQLNALRTQLNPHFLFNTLNAVTAAGYRDPELADRVLTRLAELLRTSLSFDTRTITLGEEIAFLHGYLEIHQLLLQGRLHVDVHVEPEVWHAQVPPMLLQPLVENAIMHGVATSAGRGEVQVQARRDGAWLRVVIENTRTDASGGREARADRVAGPGLGLRNTRDRLQLLYGDAWSLRLDTGCGVRTALDLRLPLQRGRGDADA